eukprot:Nitzschia sp. Nitz4//scaffold146_size56529//35862//43033//NITZ4_006579-RA/size56529-snap-gene-0.64-mRNA-1//1//CDS//3329536644//3303//frame0
MTAASSAHGGDGEHGAHDEHSHSLHHSTSLRLEDDVPFYSPPHQRQRSSWGSPGSNLGDLYWDLFYVSGAFNLAAGLKECLNTTGLLYFVACFLNIFQMWQDKLAFDTRWVAQDNLCLRVLEILQYCILGTAVQHIRTAMEMSETGQDMTMFIFALSMFLYHCTHMYKDYDVFRNGHGGPEAKSQASNDLYGRLASFFLTGGAALWCLYELWTGMEGVNHGPISLLLVSYFGTHVNILVVRYVIMVWKKQTHQEIFVPMNIEQSIHRMGEWVTLMLGESILALLIVEQSQGHRYFVTFYSGIVQITFFHYLYFRCSPFDPDDHATRRSVSGAFYFLYGFLLYSLSLLCVGCSFKMILHLYLSLEEEPVPSDDEIEEKSRAIAKLYSWSLAMSYFSLDLMLVSHRGWVSTFARLQRHGRILFMPAFCLSLDFAIMMGQAYLWKWIENLEVITVAGLCLSVGQVLLRTRGMRYFPVSKNAVVPEV